MCVCVWWKERSDAVAKGGAGIVSEMATLCNDSCIPVSLSCLGDDDASTHMDGHQGDDESVHTCLMVLQFFLYLYIYFGAMSDAPSTHGRRNRRFHGGGSERHPETSRIGRRNGHTHTRTHTRASLGPKGGGGERTGEGSNCVIEHLQSITSALPPPTRETMFRGVLSRSENREKEKLSARGTRFFLYRHAMETREKGGDENETCASTHTSQEGGTTSCWA